MPAMPTVALTVEAAAIAPMLAMQTTDAPPATMLPTGVMSRDTRMTPSRSDDVASPLRHISPRGRHRQCIPST
jgi:hypothetical protein